MSIPNHKEKNPCWSSSFFLWEICNFWLMNVVNQGWTWRKESQQIKTPTLAYPLPHTLPLNKSSLSLRQRDLLMLSAWLSLPGAARCRRGRVHAEGHLQEHIWHTAISHNHISRFWGPLFQSRSLSSLVKQITYFSFLVTLLVKLYYN